MVLVDSQIEKRLLEIVNVSKSENVRYQDLLKQVNPNSLDLTIGKSYKRPNPVKNPVLYGFSSEEERKLYNLAYWTDCDADNDGGYIVLKPNDIILGVTREYLTMPKDISGQLFTKSTMGRMFINHMMAGLVDAGFSGRLTLELKNDSVHTIRIPVGAPVVQMTCFGLETAPRRTYSDASRHSRYMHADTVECAKWKGVADGK